MTQFIDLPEKQISNIATTAVFSFSLTLKDIG